MYAINNVNGLVKDLREVKYVVLQFENSLTSRGYSRIVK